MSAAKESISEASRGVFEIVKGAFGCLAGLFMVVLSLLFSGLMFFISVWLAFWFLRLIGVMAP